MIPRRIRFWLFLPLVPFVVAGLAVVFALHNITGWIIEKVAR